VFICSTAALHVAAYLGGAWKLWFIAHALPTPTWDVFYALFARYRYKIFGKYDHCMLPPAVQDRFLAQT
jgi:predicted DCC family thiol-disulfide oxidoreductase YuxK